MLGGGGTEENEKSGKKGSHRLRENTGNLPKDGGGILL